MQKMMKLSDTHYILVDDEVDIKVADIVVEKLLTGRYELFTIHTLNDIDEVRQKKVTHSTQAVERYYSATDGTIPFVYHKVKPLSLSEVEEVVYGYSYHKMAVEYCNKHYKQQDWVENFDNYCSGFNAHKELVKDKLFTIQDMFAAIKLARQDFDEGGYTIDVMHPKEIIQSLLPKTEWECIIDEQGKLKLI